MYVNHGLLKRGGGVSMYRQKDINSDQPAQSARADLGRNLFCFRNILCTSMDNSTEEFSQLHNKMDLGVTLYQTTIFCTRPNSKHLQTTIQMLLER